MDGELATLEAQQASEAQLDEIVLAVATYLEEQQALSAVYDEVNTYLRDRFDTALEHWFKADDARSRARGLVRQRAPASLILGSPRQFSPQQEEAADQLEHDLKAKGVDLRGVFEFGSIVLPKPFGEKIARLLVDWRDNRHYYQDPEVATKEVAK